MLMSKDAVITGEITTATRSVELNGVNVSENQIIGLIDGDLAVSGDTLEQVMFDMLEKIGIVDYELVTLYYGNNVTEPEAQALTIRLRESYDSQEFELVFGGQPHYHYIVSAE
jgi:dihydroxyacetone kinase-like predicted kinase